MLFNQDKSFFLTLDEGAKPVSLDLPEVVESEVPAAEASSTEQPSPDVAATEAPTATATREPKLQQLRFRPPPRPLLPNSPQARQPVRPSA